MAKKRFTAEQIASKLREAKVHLSKGLSTAEVCEKLGVTENTYCRWRRECGGMRIGQAKRLKELERENSGLKTLVADEAMYWREGFRVGKDRMERIWQQEGLEVPQRQPKRGRLWFNESSCVRLRASYPNHVWSYDFVHDRTHDGRAIQMLAVMEEYTKECLAIDVARRLSSENVLDRLAQLFVDRGTPDYLRSDQGPEFMAGVVREWLGRVQVNTLFIEHGSPWENGYIESFNRKLRDELLDRKISYMLREAKLLGSV